MQFGKMSSLKQLSNIDDRSKLTVYGWMRNIQKSYNWTNFPLSELASICILYFASGERFEYIAKCMELSENNLSVTKENRKIGIMHVMD